MALKLFYLEIKMRNGSIINIKIIKIFFFYQNRDHAPVMIHFIKGSQIVRKQDKLISLSDTFKDLNIYQQSKRSHASWRQHICRLETQRIDVQDSQYTSQCTRYISLPNYENVERIFN